MANKLRLPPTGRDFDAYLRVTVEQFSTRQAARDLGISQTRVCQIVARVADYLLQVAPASVSPEDKGRQVYVAQQIAAEQVRFYAMKAYESFERTIGRQTIEREVTSENRPKAKIKTTKDGAGDIRYLNQAARLSLLGAELPPPNLMGLLPDELADEMPAEEADDDAEDGDEWELEEAAVTPPKEACSPASVNPTGEEFRVRPGMDANPSRENASESWSEARVAVSRTEARAERPVQLPQLLVDLGLPEDQLEDFLSSPEGLKVRQRYEALFPGVSSIPVRNIPIGSPTPAASAQIPALTP